MNNNKKNTIFRDFIFDTLYWGLANCAYFVDGIRNRENLLDLIKNRKATIKEASGSDYEFFKKGGRNAGTSFLATIALVAALNAMPNSSPDLSDTPENPTTSIGQEVPTFSSPIYYKIGSGDNLENIARAFGVSISKIMQDNPQITNKNRIQVGDIITINDSTTFPFWGDHCVLEGETIESIAKFYNVAVKEIQEVNVGIDLLSIKPGDYISLPADWAYAYNAGNLQGKIYLDINEAKGINIEEIINDEDNIVVEYTIKSGDKLEIIARKFGVSTSSILGANPNITNPNQIQTGVTIKIVNPTKTPAIDNNNDNSNNEQTDNFVAAPEGCEKGIDISSTCGKPNWDKLEAAYKQGKFSYIILRLAENSISPVTNDYSFALDKEFETNLQECNKRNIPYGVYIFTRGETIEKIELQAKSSVAYLKQLEDRGIKFRPSLPVYGDFWEDSATKQMQVLNSGRYEECVEFMVRFNEIIEEAGYFAGLYYNKSSQQLLSNAENADLLNQYTHWIAAWSGGERPVTEIGYNGSVKLGPIVAATQVSERGLVDGVNACVDVNISLIELRNMVRNFYINKYGEDYYNTTTASNLSAIGDSIESQTLNAVYSDERLKEELVKYGICYVKATNKTVSCATNPDTGEEILYVGEPIENREQMDERLTKEAKQTGYRRIMVSRRGGACI